MKRIVLALLLCAITGSAAILQNDFTTNAFHASSAGGLLVPDGSGGFVVVATASTNAFFMHIGSSYTWRTGPVIDGSGNLFVSGSASLSNTTNKLTIVGGILYLDGVAVASNSTTNYYSTLIVTNLVVSNLYATNFYVSNVVVQNNITVKGKAVSFTSVNGTNALQPNFKDTATVTWGYDGGSNITATAVSSGGGASVWVPNTALTYSGGTNVTIDGSGGTNFFLLVTNTAFFATPSNVPASKSTNTSFCVYFQMDGTGTWDVTWTNGSFKWPGGSGGQFKPTTNASAVSWVCFTMSPFTNGIFMGDYGVLDSK